MENEKMKDSSHSRSFDHKVFRQSLLSRKEEKLVALLAYSSFKLVATIGFRNDSVATSSSSQFTQAVLKWAANAESLRIHNRTAARHRCYSGSDVTRLVATEDVRNKHSLRESSSLKLS